MDWVTLTANQLLLSTISKTSKKLLLIPKSPNKLRWRLKKQKQNHYHPKPPMMILWSQHTIWGEVRETASQPANQSTPIHVRCIAISVFCKFTIIIPATRRQQQCHYNMYGAVSKAPLLWCFIYKTRLTTLFLLYTFVVDRMKVLLWLLCLPQLKSYAYVDHFNMI